MTRPSWVRWPRRLERRIGLLIIAMSVLLALVGGAVSVLLTQAVLRSSVDEQLRTITGHAHASIDDLAAESPPRAVVIWRADGQDTIRSPGSPVSAADRAVLDQVLDRGPGLRSVKLPTRDDMRVMVVKSPTHLTLVAINVDDNERDLARLAGLEGVVWLLCGSVAAIGGVAVTRRLARPLRDVARTASEIAGAPVDSVSAAVTRRVAEDGANVAEVDAVVRSTNALLHQIESAMRRRDESEEALRAFLADVSHELRTPIAVVRSHAEVGQRLLKRDASPASAVFRELQSSLERMEREGDRMGRLVDDLLLLARVDGTRHRQIEPVDLTFLALEVMSDAKMLAPQHRWGFAAPDEPVEIVGHADGVRRVLTNLVTNARKHTPAGTQVTVSVGSTADGAWLRVTDDGPGLPAEVAHAPGQRFTGRNPDDHTSTGLGLAITRSLVESMSGRIAFDSSAQGTTITVSLPSDLSGDVADLAALS